MLISDLALALVFYGAAAFHLMPFVYASFALTVGLGRWLRGRRSIAQLVVAVLAAALLFYLIANFGVWARGGLYPRTWEGLLACYVAAIPYLRNMLLGNLAYSVVLFGAYALACLRVPALREERAPVAAEA
jgi:hypothetical protein